MITIEDLAQYNPDNKPVMVVAGAEDSISTASLIIAALEDARLSASDVLILVANDGIVGKHALGTLDDFANLKGHVELMQRAFELPSIKTDMLVREHFGRKHKKQRPDHHPHIPHKHKPKWRNH